MRQLSLIPQLHSSCALNENLLSLNTLGTERDTLEVISSEVAPNDEVCIENNQSVQEHDNHNENNLSGVEIDKISQKLNLPIEETSNSSVNKDSNHDLIGLNIDSEGLAVSRTLDQNMPVESNVCLLQREGITRGMNNGIPERRKCGKQPEDSHIVVEKITSVGEESQSDFEDCCIVSEVNLGTSDNTTKCVFHALGIPGCCQVQDSLLPNSEEKNKLDNSTANMYKKECAYPDEQHCITKNRSSSSTGSSREVCSNKENTVLDSMPAELDPEEPGPSHRLRIGEIPFEKSSDPSCSIIEPDNADSDERCSRRANNEPDFRVQNVLYSYDKEDFSTSVWSPLKWNPRAQPLKSALKKADGRRELSYRPQVKIRNENITKFLTYHRLPEEPIGNIARVNDSVIPVDERFPVRFTRGMAKHIEKIKTANEALTEWLRQCWDSLSDRAREAIRENRRDLGLADDVYVLGCNEDDCSHDEQPEDNLVIVNETVDDEGEIQIVAYKFNTIEDDFVVHAPEIMSDELTKNISSYEDSSVIHMDQNPSEKMPKGPVSTDSSSVRCTSIKEEELASLQSSAMEETVEQCPVESVSGSLTCHPNDPVKEEPTGQICVDIPMACHQSDSSRPAVKSETLGEEPGDEQAISAELFCLLSDQSMETSVKQETMMNQDPLELNLIDFASMYPMLDRAMQTVEEETPLKCHMKDASVQTSVEWKTVKKMIFSPTRCLKDASVQTLPEDETQMETVLTGSKYLLTDASVQTSTEGETQTQDISVALKRILIDASVQASTVGNDISLQTEMVGNDTSVQTEIFGNDTSVQTETVGNDTSVQTEIVGNDMSVQTEIVGNDMSVQTEIVGNDMSVQTEIVGNDMSVQTEIIGNDMSVQTEIVGKDASVQISADLTDAAVQTSSEVAQMEELAAALKNFLNDVSNQVSRMSANALVQRLIEEETQVEGLGSEGNLPSTSKAFHKEASVQKNVEPASLSNSNHEQLPVVDLQHSGESSSGRVASEPRDTEGPFYPPLMDCEDFAANLVHDLTEPHRAVVLVRKMVELRIATIGDFCSESPSVISQLPLKEPKLATALAALKNYENQKSPEEKVSRIEAVNIPGCQLNHQSEEPVTSGRIPVITRVESLRTLTPSYAALISYREALEFWRGNRNQIESGERAENVQEENTPVLASHSQFSQGSVEDMHSDMISSEEPIFPALQNCSDDINNIIGDLTDTIWSKPLIEKLEENGIFTVGDLCSKSAAYVLQLPVKEPKLSSTLQVLENYYNSRFEKETKVFDQSEEDVIPSSQGSSGSTAVNLEELVANIPANQLVQAILASPQRMECVSELVHAIGSVEKVMQFLVDVKVTEVLNEYWKRIREPLQERFSHDVVEFVTKRVLASTGPDNSNSLLVNPRSFSKTNKPGLTLRSRQSLQTMVKKHGWTAVCKLIPDHELKRFLSSCNFDTLKQLFPPHVLSEYIQREIRRDKIFCKQIIQMALNAHLPTAQNDATSLWNTVTRDMCCNEEQYQLVKEFILRPDTLNFIAQMTELLTLLKPVCEKGQTLSTNSRSILPDGVLRNLLKIVHKQMQPKDFISACSKSMMDIL
ncbi:uncharacterized protein [Anabrus simplex]|uniref:uncharacterized protein n=1 Tax=Anabrus simplex TaxID=316456 RepID=UPI0035A29582